MRNGKWFIAAAAGASLSLFSASSLAQVKTGVREPEVPKAKALGLDPEADAPTSKGLGSRREARRLPVIDANAGVTFRSTQLIGTNITDADGRTIGRIVDFVSDARGNLLYQVVSYSGSPGFTGKLFAIPPSGLTFSAGANNTTTASFAFDPTLLKNAPSFSSLQFPDFSDPKIVNQIQAFYATVLGANDFTARKTTADPTVPANGPGDRVQTQEQAGTPARPVDPSLPANGPGDRPATVNPALPNTGTVTPSRSPADSPIPGTTGTENAGFPSATPSTIGGTGSPASSTTPGGTVVGATGSPASSSTVGTNLSVNSRVMLRSSQMLGMAIQDNRGQEIGTVVDFVGNGGNNQFAVVSLGTDGRLIVVPSSALHFQSGAKGSSFATLRIAPGQLKNAPSFSANQWPNFGDAKFTNQVSTFYSDKLPTPGASKGYDYGQFPTTSPDGTKYPETAAPRAKAPGTAPATAPGTIPRPGASPRLPAPGTGAPGVPGVPGLPGGKAPAPGAAPGAPGAAPGGAPAGPGVKLPR
jgi:ribosomal 30S subunit maturation factor RimM